MAKPADIFVSIILIVDQRSSQTAQRLQAVAKLARKHYLNYEVVIVDNGLPKADLAACKRLLGSVACLRIIRLARQEDIDTAVFAGVENAIGDNICILYNQDPIDKIPDFIIANLDSDIVFGVAENLRRRTLFEQLGARLFYWYNKRYLHIQIPAKSTYFMSINRTVANALTRNNRSVRHIRQLAITVGFGSTNLKYSLTGTDPYIVSTNRGQILKAFDMVTGYSNHPLRVLTYFGAIAGFINLLYAIYVVIVRFSVPDVERGWTTLSLQSAIMFFVVLTILAVLSEYIGKIFVEAKHEPPYHVMQELSSTVSFSDETRRNIAR